jgi:hypothetical protein
MAECFPVKSRWGLFAKQWSVKDREQYQICCKVGLVICSIPYEQLSGGISGGFPESTQS